MMTYEDAMINDLQTQVDRLRAERDRWRSLAAQFFDACELDGFGAVYQTHIGDLSQAVRDYKKEIHGD